MLNRTLTKVGVAINPMWFDRMCRVCYLIVPYSISDMVKPSVSDAFFKQLKKMVDAYISKGTMPPAAIAGPVMNVADDVLAGREPMIKAGDYYAIQNYLKKK